MDKTLLGMMVLTMPLLAVSCNDDSETGTADDWQARNVAYVDSLTAVWRAQQDDPSSVAEGDTLYRLDTQYTPDGFLYYKRRGVADGFGGVGETAKFTDVVRVYYKGWLIDGTEFDSNYSGDYPDYELDIPTDFTVSGLQASSGGIIYGWTEILQVMRPAANATDKRGDMFRVFIPADQGYGASASGSVPANSTLIFDINLVEVNPDD